MAIRSVFPRSSLHTRDASAWREGAHRGAIVCRRSGSNPAGGRAVGLACVLARADDRRHRHIPGARSLHIRRQRATGRSCGGACAGGRTRRAGQFGRPDCGAGPGQRCIAGHAGCLLPEDARALELWLVPGEGAPVSLGLVPGDGGQLVLDESIRNRLSAGALLAVSIEPVGGSPTGAPTGPVVLSGALSEN
ncbi:anti-sigma factor domain-containing protein [Hoeflea sp.]|uniref:anti-sigma factor domain-containing protein n=1 Tax=Hoeflea sp. TaxID=1940281 RepID=UPI003BB0E576